MTRLAILGSSHVGAIRQAAPQIMAAYPGLEIAWFALPGASFRSMQVDGDGVLRFDAAHAAEAEMAARINGDLCLDLTPFDRIWVIGNRFGFAPVMRLFLEHDVLEWPRSKVGRTMSEAFGMAVLRGMVETSCAAIENRFGRDSRLVLTPGPYFNENALKDGIGFDKWMSKIFVHPRAQYLEDMFEATIRDRLAARGMAFLPQPTQTRAMPFATRAEFGRDARDFRDLDRQITDFHHMNADFGLALFRAFAELHLGRG